MQCLSCVVPEFQLSLQDQLQLYSTEMDSVPGSGVYTSLVSALEKSRKIIIVLSNSFLRNEKCLGEVDMAGERVLFVKYALKRVLTS